MVKMTQPSIQPSRRLFVYLASEAPVAVILKRGPSRWVQLVKWQTDTDIFEPGQWLQARVYEDRCDLSPQGTHFVYFARKPILKPSRKNKVVLLSESFTAISKPPYFTALVLWFGIGTYFGGGFFESQTQLWLNTGGSEAQLHPDFQPGPLVVTTARRPADELWWIPNARRRQMVRSGWQRMQGERPPSKQKEMVELWERRSPDGHTRLQYRDQKYYLILSNLREVHLAVSWIDWDQQQRLVFARDGKIFAADIQRDQVLETELVDFNPYQFEPIPSPAWARSW